MTRSERRGWNERERSGSLGRRVEETVQQGCCVPKADSRRTAAARVEASVDATQSLGYLLAASLLAGESNQHLAFSATLRPAFTFTLLAWPVRTLLTNLFLNSSQTCENLYIDLQTDIPGVHRREYFISPAINVCVIQTPSYHHGCRHASRSAGTQRQAAELSGSRAS